MAINNRLCWHKIRVIYLFMVNSTYTPILQIFYIKKYNDIFTTSNTKINKNTEDIEAYVYL